MASVVASVAGGTPKRCAQVETVGDVRSELGLAENYTAAVDGEPADDDTLLADEQYVSFSASVKGGKR